MRDSPALQVTVRCFGGWLIAVSLLVGGSLATLLVWLWQLDTARSTADWLLAGCASVVIAAAATCLRSRPISLRWDSQAWWLGDADQVGDEPSCGDVELPVDLSGWMLLRFVRASGGRWHRVSWIPLQRRGLELHWHALRCAVHTARPAKDGYADDSRAAP